MVFGKKKKEKKELKEKPTTNFSISHATIPAQQDSEGFTAEDIRLIIAEWLKEDHVHFKTRYTKRQVRAMTKLQPVADRYEIDCLQKVLNEFRIAKLSEEGQSSKELVDILRERLAGFMEEKTNVNTGGLGKFFE
jgi:uncharacterized protein YggU (UPF0235/DUF167 family)